MHGQVSAVSSRTNTTEASRLGAFTEGPCQVALYDTPGVVSTRYDAEAFSPPVVLAGREGHVRTALIHLQAVRLRVS